MTNDIDALAVPVTLGLRHSSNSETALYKECRRRWWLRHSLRIRPNGGDVVAGPLWIGTLVHVGHDARFKALAWGANDEQSIKCCFFALKSLAHRRFKEGAQVDYDNVELARIMLEGYWQWEGDEGILQQYQILGTEIEMQMPIVLSSGEVIIWLGKADVIAINAITGYYWIIDKKTVASLIDPAAGLQRNDQMMGYLMLLAAKLAVDAPGSVVDGATFSMLRKVKRTAKANPPFYAHVTVQYNREEHRNFLKRLTYTLEDIMALRDKVEPFNAVWRADPRSPEANIALTAAAQIAYITPTPDCSWKCEFVGICDMFNDGSRVADAIADNFSERDPLERYDTPHIDVQTHAI